MATQHDAILSAMQSMLAKRHPAVRATSPGWTGLPFLESGTSRFVPTTPVMPGRNVAGELEAAKRQVADFFQYRNPYKKR